MKLELLLALGLAATTAETLRADTSNVLSVAVLELTSPDKAMAQNITDLVRAGLSADERLVLVERAELKKVLGEQSLGLSGTIDADTAAKIGRLSGAKVLVSGRVFKTSGQLIAVAHIIGAETGKAYAETVQNAETNQLDIANALAKAISQTIVNQETNLLASAGHSREERLASIIKSIQGDHRPAVQITVDERNADPQRPRRRRARARRNGRAAETADASSAAETELGLIFQKAGFLVVDEKSDTRPDVLVTGEAAVNTVATKRSGLFSCEAALEIKAQDRKTGKILAIDRQQSAAVDVSKLAAANTAVENATDALAERLLPLLAQ